MSLFRRAGATIARFFTSAADPAAVAGELQLYSKVDGGVSQLFGRSDDGTVHQITPAGAGGGIGPGFFGDGSDGSATMDGVTTVAGIAPAGSQYNQTRDLHFEDLTIDVGVLLFTNGWRLFVSGTLTLNGTVGRFGRAGDVGGFGVGGAGGAGRPAAILGSSGGGGSASLSIAGAAQAQCPPGFSGAGGAGGTGGDGAGGIGGTVTASDANTGSLANLWQAILGRQVSGAVAYNAGGGGGAGGAATGGTWRGGGGGGGGGQAIVCAYEIIGSGVVVCYGGTGGAGSPAGGGIPIGGGGGGGGGGGWIVLVIGIGSFPVTDVSGGAGGAGGTGAIAGSPGTPGIAGGVTFFRLGS